MSSLHYSDEKNVLILIALLKHHNIKKIVASPGATNYTFVGSLQNDPFFEIYSSVDERSAAYIACGLAAESGEPVVLTCTGATASRNYYPGLTEAFYRKLPVLAVTSHQGNDRIGQLIYQNIDRRKIPADIACLSIELPVVKDDRDEAYAVMEANKAVLELFRNGGGPVHINLFTTYSANFDVLDLPKVKCFSRYFAWDHLPDIPDGKIGVYVGSHDKFTDKENEAIERFCATHDAVVFCDHTSGYYGKYMVLPTLALLQGKASYPLPELDLMIHIGEVSGATFNGMIRTKTVWRVNPDGEIRDPYKKLSNVFQMSEDFFFNHYSDAKSGRDGFANSLQELFKSYYTQIPELPFSNIWIAQHLSPLIPTGSLFHISASHSRRAWNIFPFPKGVESMCNVGVCGIDGCTSTLFGASLADPNRICYLVTGDLAFFYDLNVLGNRHMGRNVRILLINNGIGGEFKITPHKCKLFGEEADKYMAAGGHFGHKSPKLIKHFAEDLGFEYLTASDKDSFQKSVARFTDSEIGERSIIFEVFTDALVEDEAFLMISSITTDTVGKAKETARKVLGDKGIKFAKRILGK